MSVLSTREVQALWARLAETGREQQAGIEAALKEAGHPPLAWYEVLSALKGAGRGGVRPFVLQQTLGLSQYNLSRLIDRLQRSGLVDRQPCTEDGRGHLVRLTQAGKRTLKAMTPIFRAALARQFADRLRPKDLRRLGDILERLQPPPKHTDKRSTGAAR